MRLTGSHSLIVRAQYKPGWTRCARAAFHSPSSCDSSGMLTGSGGFGLEKVDDGTYCGAQSRVHRLDAEGRSPRLWPVTTPFSACALLDRQIGLMVDLARRNDIRGMRFWARRSPAISSRSLAFISRSRSVNLQPAMHDGRGHSNDLCAAAALGCALAMSRDRAKTAWHRRSGPRVRLMSPRARSRSRGQARYMKKTSHGLLVESVGAPYLTYIKKQCYAA